MYLTSIQRPQGNVTIVPNGFEQIQTANSKTFTYDADGDGDLLTDYGRTYNGTRPTEWSRSPWGRATRR